MSEERAKRGRRLLGALTAQSTVPPVAAMPEETFRRLFISPENEARKELTRLRKAVRDSHFALLEILGLPVQRPKRGQPRLDETQEFWQEAFRLVWAIDVLGLPKATAFRVVTKTKSKRGLSASDYRWLNTRLAKARQALSPEAETAWPGDAVKAIRTLPLEKRIALAR